MKFKQHVVITNADDFLKGNYYSCFALFETESSGCNGWFDCGQIEFDINVNTGEMVSDVGDAIRFKIEEIKEESNAKIVVLETRLGELLALGPPHD